MMKYISHQVTWHFLRPVVKRMTLTSFFCSASILTEMLVFLVKWVGNAHRKVWPQNAARHSKPRTLYTNTKDIPPYIFNGRAETALLAYRPIHKWLIIVLDFYLAPFGQNAVWPRIQPLLRGICESKEHGKSFKGSKEYIVRFKSHWKPKQKGRENKLKPVGRLKSDTLEDRCQFFFFSSFSTDKSRSGFLFSVSDDYFGATSWNRCWILFV